MFDWLRKLRKKLNKKEPEFIGYRKEVKGEDEYFVHPATTLAISGFINVEPSNNITESTFGKDPSGYYSGGESGGGGAERSFDSEPSI